MCDPNDSVSDDELEGAVGGVGEPHAPVLGTDPFYEGRDVSTGR